MLAPSPTLAANVMHFARMLRRAGLPVGPAETLARQQALSLIDLGNRTEARTALRTAMIHRHEHQDVFDQAFNLFWRDPTAAEQAVTMALLDAQKEKHKERPPSGTRRVAEAMARLDEALVATHLVTASGSLGSCLAYLTETLEALQVAGLRDYSLERLRKMGEGQPCWRRHGHAVTEDVLPTSRL